LGGMSQKPLWPEKLSPASPRTGWTWELVLSHLAELLATGRQSPVQGSQSSGTHGVLFVRPDLVPGTHAHRLLRVPGWASSMGGGSRLGSFQVQDLYLPESELCCGMKVLQRGWGWGGAWVGPTVLVGKELRRQGSPSPRIPSFHRLGQSMHQSATPACSETGSMPTPRAASLHSPLSPCDQPRLVPQAHQRLPAGRGKDMKAGFLCTCRGRVVHVHM
jgi:hypothetical protein